MHLRFPEWPHPRAVEPCSQPTVEKPEGNPLILVWPISARMGSLWDLIIYFSQILQYDSCGSCIFGSATGGILTFSLFSDYADCGQGRKNIEKQEAETHPLEFRRSTN